MLYDERAVRDNLRNRDGKRVFYLGTGDQLNSAARDYLTRERIEILPASQARPRRYRLPGGGWTEEKPEHMTHLHGDLLVPKNHPRIVFRGKLDTLESELLIAQLTATSVSEKLGQVLEMARKLIRWDVLEEPVSEDTICVLTEAEIRKISHFPGDVYGIPHFMPQASDGMALARVNRARCAAREAELAAVSAFSDRDGQLLRPDLVRMLNRMSSMLYILMIEMKAGTL